MDDLEAVYAMSFGIWKSFEMCPRCQGDFMATDGKNYWCITRNCDYGRESDKNKKGIHDKKRTNNASSDK